MENERERAREREREREKKYLLQVKLCLLFFVGYTYAGCPSGWAGYGSNCYRLFTGALEWSLAARDCQRYGANLVSIDSSGEQYFVESTYTF